MPINSPFCSGIYNEGVTATVSETLSALSPLQAVLPATLTIPDMSEEDFLAVCAQFPDSLVEYTADGRLIIMPPTDQDTSLRNARIIQQLFNWMDAGGKGRGSESHGGFLLPNGSRVAPDAAWFNEERWNRAAASGRSFPVFAPEFVVELRSRYDRLADQQEKMRQYMASGVQLGWLIDPFSKRVEIYRPGRPVEVLESPTEVRGEGPVEGFVLDLKPIFI